MVEADWKEVPPWRRGMMTGLKADESNKIMGAPLHNNER